MQILMYVDDTPLAERAVRYGALVAAPAAATVTLLAVANSPAEESQARTAVENAQRLLPVSTQVIVRPGRGVRELLREAETGQYGLIVVGSRGRRGWQRLAFGSVAARLARYSPIPVLIVKGPARPTLRRILACSAADAPSQSVARWSGQLAGWLGAELTLMHVMSQMAMSPQTPIRQLTVSADEAIAEATREGRHLASQLQVAQAAAPQSRVRAKLRHGLVVDEVAAEAAQGDYDLVIIGGHQAPTTGEGLDRLRTYLLEDVADKIVMELARPVMVVKGD
jgi:nucleotide-binding universal stress UspA family protein